MNIKELKQKKKELWKRRLPILKDEEMYHLDCVEFDKIEKELFSLGADLKEKYLPIIEKNKDKLKSIIQFKEDDIFKIYGGGKRDYSLIFMCESRKENKWIHIDIDFFSNSVLIKKKDNMFNTYYWRYKDININIIREIFHRAAAI